ncbi:TAXI family TRAP transporter solute-binding subunit [Mycobacterium intracellulare]|uniref:TAXI family TRAP transporter solute-binding subunit n=1 Tax=Mycobacterium intracellulare TaxID=1767 RepID=UPI00334557E8
MTDSTATAQTRPEEPRIERPFTLHLKADWGTQNLHRVCGWICQELLDRAGPLTRVAIWNGDGSVGSVRAVANGEVDIALSVPQPIMFSAFNGRGLYAGEAYPQLRALGVVPQRDRMVVALRRDLGISSFPELRKHKPTLALTTGANDGLSHVGWTAHEILRRSGVDVVSWGGEFLEADFPFLAFDYLVSGRANAIIHEALMLPAWQKLAPELAFLPFEEETLDGFAADFNWPSAVVREGYLPETPQLEVLDFSDFVVFTRDDLPDDIAYAVAWILGETSETVLTHFGYRALYPTSEYSPINYPFDPVAVGTTPIPLHPGAARYFDARAKGRADA